LDVERFALILEFMPEGSLISHIIREQGKFKWADRLQMMLDICEGMAYLHSTENADGTVKPRVYHQDLKSGNVLLTRNNNGKLRGKIGDFGLAGMIKSLTILALKYEETGVSSCVSVNGGTKCYQAPELWTPHAKFHSKADVFAAGVVFLELISLQPPNTLYRDLWPKILTLEMNQTLLLSLMGTLHDAQESRMTFDELFLMLSCVEAKEIADQDNEEYAAEFFDISGRVQDFIASCSSRLFSQTEDS
jgi:serine/threonine protein kinase